MVLMVVEVHIAQLASSVRPSSHTLLNFSICSMRENMSLPEVEGRLGGCGRKVAIPQRLCYTG